MVALRRQKQDPEPEAPATIAVEIGGRSEQVAANSLLGREEAAARAAEAELARLRTLQARRYSEMSEVEAAIGDVAEMDPDELAHLLLRRDALKKIHPELVAKVRTADEEASRLRKNVIGTAARVARARRELQALADGKRRHMTREDQQYLWRQYNEELVTLTGEEISPPERFQAAEFPGTVW